MRKLIFFLFFTLFIVACEKESENEMEPESNVPDSVDVTSAKTRSIEYSILRYTNQERVARDRGLLKLDSALSKIARGHSRNMVEKGFFAHDNPDGQGPTDRAEEAGYEMGTDGGTYGIAENINKMPTGRVSGFGYVDDHPDSIAKATVKNWMESSGHRKNLLNSTYGKIGIGVAYDGEFYYATQNFN